MSSKKDREAVGVEPLVIPQPSEREPIFNAFLEDLNGKEVLYILRAGRGKGNRKPKRKAWRVQHEFSDRYKNFIKRDTNWGEITQAWKYIRDLFFAA